MCTVQTCKRMLKWYPHRCTMQEMQPIKPNRNSSQTKKHTQKYIVQYRELTVKTAIYRFHNIQQQSVRAPVRSHIIDLMVRKRVGTEKELTIIGYNLLIILLEINRRKNCIWVNGWTLSNRCAACSNFAIAILIENNAPLRVWHMKFCAVIYVLAVSCIQDR